MSRGERERRRRARAHTQQPPPDPPEQVLFRLLPLAHRSHTHIRPHCPTVGTTCCRDLRRDPGYEPACVCVCSSIVGPIRGQVRKPHPRSGVTPLRPFATPPSVKCQARIQSITEHLTFKERESINSAPSTHTSIITSVCVVFGLHSCVTSVRICIDMCDWSRRAEKGRMYTRCPS